MNSKWFKLKNKATSLRKQGKSIRTIEKELGIPRSTLSGWFSSIRLTKLQKTKLEKSKNDNLLSARIKASAKHTENKLARMRVAENTASKLIDSIKSTSEILELCLAVLYLGEGSKKKPSTSMGNSDPLIMKFFLVILLNVYKVDPKKIGVYLHLRADQNPEKMKRFWSKELDVPLSRFKSVLVDKRTLGTVTYPGYHGVCTIECGNVAIQRKLVYISRRFFEKTIVDLRG